MVKLMATYHYRFLASGNKDAQPASVGDILKDKLINGTIPLYMCAPFPTDSDILDRITLDTDNNEITAVNLYTYTEFQDNVLLHDIYEGTFKKCLELNLAEIAEEYHISPADAIEIKSGVQKLGKESSWDSEKAGEDMEKALEQLNIKDPGQTV